MYIVYLITREDGRKYIGSTTKNRLKKRMNEHKKHKRFLGYEFKYEVIFESDSYEKCLIEEEKSVEKHDTYKNGLNETYDGTGANRSKNFTTKGMKFSRKTRLKMSKIHKGKIPWNKGKTNIFSKETLKKMSEGQKKRDLKDFKHKITPEQNAEIIKKYENKEIEFDNIGFVRKNGHPVTYIYAFSEHMAKIYNVTTQAIYQRIKKYAKDFN